MNIYPWQVPDPFFQLALVVCQCYINDISAIKLKSARYLALKKYPPVYPIRYPGEYLTEYPVGYMTGYSVSICILNLMSVPSLPVKVKSQLQIELNTLVELILSVFQFWIGSSSYSICPHVQIRILKDQSDFDPEVNVLRTRTTKKDNKS